MYLLQVWEMWVVNCLHRSSNSRNTCYNNMRLKIKIAGMANSKKNHIDEEGIDLDNWEELLADGKPMQASKNLLRPFSKKILRNTVFADVTANETVATVYDSLLAKKYCSGGL